MTQPPRTPNQASGVALLLIVTCCGGLSCFGLVDAAIKLFRLLTP